MLWAIRREMTYLLGTQHPLRHLYGTPPKAIQVKDRTWLLRPA